MSTKSDEWQPHSDWDAAKVAAHLSDLERNQEITEALADQLSTLADDKWREASRIRGQIASCRETFGKPRGAAAKATR